MRRRFPRKARSTVQHLRIVLEGQWYFRYGGCADAELRQARPEGFRLPAGGTGPVPGRAFRSHDFALRQLRTLCPVSRDVEIHPACAGIAPIFLLHGKDL